MTRHENILSFDEARARGAVASHSSSRKSNPKQRTSLQKSRSSVYSQRLTPDHSFEQSFTSTARSGSYGTSSRTRSSVHARQAPKRVSVKEPVRETIKEVESIEEEAEQSAAASKKKKSLKHRVRSVKAERQFNKTIGAEDAKKAKSVAAEASGQSSRPALYQMKMGKTHKRSSRMQGTARSKKMGLFGKLFSKLSIFDPRSQHFSSRALITCAAAVLTVVMLYQPVANYYQEVRQHQQLEAEYEVVSEYYSNLKSEVDYLNTQEGLEEYVREELGWVKAGERVSSVEGLDARDASAQKGTITADISNAVPTPSTWYSGVLDFIFGYNKP